MSQSPFPPGPPPAQQPGPPPYAAATPYGAPPVTDRSDPAPVDATGRTGLPYHLVLRGGWDGTWWRGLIGIAVLAVGMVLALPLVMLLPFLVYYAVTGQAVGESMSGLGDLSDPSPASLAYLNLVLAGMIPLAWLLVRYLHGLRPRWLSSIAPRLRWKYLAACFGVAFVALVATVLVSSLVPAGSGAGVSGELNEFTPRIRDFVLVVLLLTPLQAAAEEYAFRGYLLQAFGGILGQLGDGFRVSWLRHPAFAVGATSLLFALAHGAQDLPIFIDRFAFGLVAGTLVVVTGGLEAGIAMHVLNNWFAFGAALAYGDMASALNPGDGTWWSLPVTLTQSLVYLALAWWVARRMGLGRRTDPAVLAAPESRV